MIASILINSKNPKNLEKVFDSYESNAADKKCFEIIVNINKNDYVTKKYLESEIIKRKFKLKYISTYEGDYFSGHINNNNMLKEVNSSTYFVSCTGDRVLAKTKFWDDELKKYLNYYDDQLFRIKCSSFKTRKYFDFWECCFSPSNITFTTKKLIEINKDLSPCFSHDAFQQCIFFYLENHDNFNSKQINRDIISNNLSFVGQEPEDKFGDDNYNRIHGQLKAWNILTSGKMQKEAKRRAMLIKANIIYNEKDKPYKIYNNKNYIIVKDNSDKIIMEYKYSVNYLSIFLVNFYRKFSYLNYCGGGFYENKQNYIFSLFWYLDFRYKKFRGIKDLYKKYLNIICGDK